ncbi:MAG: RusA family crossover junction endodeoxyribonuclease, partial [Planctomycetes bacterium]|nr:RusA family crossover junction endodeoxyribonuclease [Planctomycetota bacterium]
MTTIHLIVPGTPVSCQSKRESLRRWKDKVAAVARAHVSRPQSGNDLAIAITYFFRVPPRCDTDNLSKPICDAHEHGDRHPDAHGHRHPDAHRDRHAHE